jgi:4-hydroxy-2-oxoheptanedioate aldolase
MPTPIASLSRRLKAGDTLFIAWSAFADPAIPASMLAAGYDVALVDLQHGAWTYEGALAAVGACAALGKPCLARVPVGDFALASRLLDAGAAGIVAPMIESAADAAAFADFCKFPPLGRRSWGPGGAMRALGLGAADYLRRANALHLTFAMIETRAALDALDAILDHPGIDGVLVGPTDLSIALADGAGLDPDGADVDAALTRVAQACRARGKSAAAFCTGPERARALTRRGFQLVSIALDQAMLQRAATADLAVAKT